MPGVAQLWLTDSELEGLAVLHDAIARLAADGYLPAKGALAHPGVKTAVEKVEAALAPVACKVATDSRKPDTIPYSEYMDAKARTPQRGYEG